jgi:hypothetical protein
MASRRKLWNWFFGSRLKLNTVNLVGDNDDTEILREAESLFDIKITDEEAEAIVTIGEFERLIASKISQETKDDLAWRLICRIVRDTSGHRGIIDRNTTFFATDAEARLKNG